MSLKANNSKKPRLLHLFLLASFFAIFVWSLIKPNDFFIWWLESLPAIVGVGLLLIFYNRFRFTNLVYILVWIHAVILLIGAHYTYAQMPLFNWFREAFELSRNHYDRVGHIAQGFIPAIIARELLVRTSPLRKGGWLFFVVISICLAISAAYELLEWFAAVASDDGAVAFLATQGDVWDTQKDMALCLLGAVVSLLALSRIHDKQLKNLNR